MRQDAGMTLHCSSQYCARNGTL